MREDGWHATFGQVAVVTSDPIQGLPPAGETQALHTIGISHTLEAMPDPFLAILLARWINRANAPPRPPRPTLPITFILQYMARPLNQSPCPCNQRSTLPSLIAHIFI